MQNRHKKNFTEVNFLGKGFVNAELQKQARQIYLSTVDPLRQKERLYGLLMLESNFIKLNKSDGLGV